MTWNGQPQQIRPCWRIYEGRPLTFNDTETGCGGPNDITRQISYHCSPYGTTYGMDWVSTNILYGHRDHSRPGQRKNCPGLHPGSISLQRSCGKYHAGNTYNDWVSARLSRPTHRYWRCLWHIHQIYTYDKHYMFPVLPKPKQWNGRCWHNIGSYTTTAGWESSRSS